MSHSATVREVFRSLRPSIQRQGPSLDPREVETTLLEHEALRRIDRLFGACCYIADDEQRMLAVQTIATQMLQLVEQCERVFALSSD